MVYCSYYEKMYKKVIEKIDNVRKTDSINNAKIKK